MTDHTLVAVDDSSSDAMPWLPIVLAIVLGSTLAPNTICGMTMVGKGGALVLRWQRG